VVKAGLGSGTAAEFGGTDRRCPIDTESLER
jgi:hypothetical protein